MNTLNNNRLYCINRNIHELPHYVNNSSSNIVSKFLKRINKTSQCWLWMGPITPNGYGRFSFSGRLVSSHRFSYEFFKTAIPTGLQIDHLCRVRHCLNPNHLRVVTQKENLLSGIGPCAVNARKTHCFRGHPFTPKNTLRNAGKRRCRKCHYAWCAGRRRRIALEDSLLLGNLQNDSNRNIVSLTYGGSL